jgi:cytoskeletal protein CcmA (bactofilin family)
MYLVSKNITIEGVINGDLIALGQNINVKGKVMGDIISASQNLSVEGEVGGNIRSVANTVSLIDTVVQRNVNLVGTNVLIGENSNISWDALILAGVAEMRGTVQGSLHGVVDKLIISGDVNKDVSFTINQNDNYYQNQAIEISDDSNIKGNFSYSYSEDLNIDKSLVAGAVTFNEKALENNWQKNIWNFIITVFSTLVVGLVFISISKKEMAIIQKKVNTKYSRSLMIGLGALFLTPIVSIILMMTVIGIPLGFIMLIIWFIMLYFAQIMVGLGLGKQIRERLFKAKKKNIMADLIIGVTVLYLLFAIPILGGIIMFFSTLLGLGVIWRYKRFRISSLN